MKKTKFSFLVIILLCSSQLLAENINQPESRTETVRANKEKSHLLSVGEYVVFLNAVAQKSDLHQLYNTSSMENVILRNEVGDRYSYVIVTGTQEKDSMLCLSKFDAMRYCNWVENGSLSEDAPVILTNDFNSCEAMTETGAYVLKDDHLLSSNPEAIYHMDEIKENGIITFLIRTKPVLSDSPLMMFGAEEASSSVKVGEQNNVADRIGMSRGDDQQGRIGTSSPVIIQRGDFSTGIAENTSPDPNISAASAVNANRANINGIKTSIIAALGKKSSGLIFNGASLENITNVTAFSLGLVRWKRSSFITGRVAQQIIGRLRGIEPFGLKPSKILGVRKTSTLSTPITARAAYFPVSRELISSKPIALGIGRSIFFPNIFGSRARAFASVASERDVSSVNIEKPVTLDEDLEAKWKASQETSNLVSNPDQSGKVDKSVDVAIEQEAKEPTEMNQARWKARKNADKLAALAKAASAQDAIIESRSVDTKQQASDARIALKDAEHEWNRQVDEIEKVRISKGGIPFISPEGTRFAWSKADRTVIKNNEWVAQVKRWILRAEADQLEADYCAMANTGNDSLDKASSYFSKVEELHEQAQLAEKEWALLANDNENLQEAQLLGEAAVNIAKENLKRADRAVNNLWSLEIKEFKKNEALDDALQVVRNENEIFQSETEEKWKARITKSKTDAKAADDAWNTHKKQKKDMVDRLILASTTAETTYNLIKQAQDAGSTTELIFNFTKENLPKVIAVVDAVAAGAAIVPLTTSFAPALFAASGTLKLLHGNIPSIAPANRQTLSEVITSFKNGCQSAKEAADHSLNEATAAYENDSIDDVWKTNQKMISIVQAHEESFALFNEEVKRLSAIKAIWLSKWKSAVESHANGNPAEWLALTKKEREIYNTTALIANKARADTMQEKIEKANAEIKAARTEVDRLSSSFWTWFTTSKSKEAAFNRLTKAEAELAQIENIEDGKNQQRVLALFNLVRTVADIANEAQIQADASPIIERASRYNEVIAKRNNVKTVLAQTVTALKEFLKKVPSHRDDLTSWWKTKIENAEDEKNQQDILVLFNSVKTVTDLAKTAQIQADASPIIEKASLYDQVIERHTDVNTALAQTITALEEGLAAVPENRDDLKSWWRTKMAETKKTNNIESTYSVHIKKILALEDAAKATMEAANEAAASETRWNDAITVAHNSVAAWSKVVSAYEKTDVPTDLKEYWENKIKETKDIQERVFLKYEENKKDIEARRMSLELQLRAQEATQNANKVYRRATEVTFFSSFLLSTWKHRTDSSVWKWDRTIEERNISIEAWNNLITAYKKGGSAVPSDRDDLKSWWDARLQEAEQAKTKEDNLLAEHIKQKKIIIAHHENNEKQTAASELKSQAEEAMKAANKVVVTTSDVATWNDAIVSRGNSVKAWDKLITAYQVGLEAVEKDFFELVADAELTKLKTDWHNKREEAKDIKKKEDRLLVKYNTLKSDAQQPKEIPDTEAAKKAKDAKKFVNWYEMQGQRASDDEQQYDSQHDSQYDSQYDSGDGRYDDGERVWYPNTANIDPVITLTKVAPFRVAVNNFKNNPLNQNWKQVAVSLFELQEEIKKTILNSGNISYYNKNSYQHLIIAINHTHACLTLAENNNNFYDIINPTNGAAGATVDTIGMLLATMGGGTLGAIVGPGGAAAGAAAGAAYGRWLTSRQAVVFAGPAVLEKAQLARASSYDAYMAALPTKGTAAENLGLQAQEISKEIDELIKYINDFFAKYSAKK